MEISDPAAAAWGGEIREERIKGRALNMGSSYFFKLTFYMIQCVFDHLVFISFYSEVFLDMQEEREKRHSVSTLCQVLYLCPLI